MTATLFDLAELDAPTEWRDPVDADLAPAEAHAGLTSYRGFEIGDDDETIRAAFEKKFGRKPAQILRQPSIVLAGPV